MNEALIISLQAFRTIGEEIRRARRGLRFMSIFNMKNMQIQFAAWARQARPKKLFFDAGCKK
jgi:hypothetical protein